RSWPTILSSRDARRRRSWLAPRGVLLHHHPCMGGGAGIRQVNMIISPGGGGFLAVLLDGPEQQQDQDEYVSAEKDQGPEDDVHGAASLPLRVATPRRCFRRR